MIEVRCCHSLSDAAPVRVAMDALNRASARPDPFSTFEYYENRLRIAVRFPPAPGLRLWLLLAFRNGALIGYAALKQTRHRVLGLHAAKLDWLTAGVADRPHLVARPEDAVEVGAAIHAYLLQRRREWSLLEFEQQEESSPLRRLPAAAAAECRVREWPSPANGTIPIRWASLAAYFAALPKKSRSNVSRQMRTLLAEGEVRLLTSSAPQAAGAMFALYRGIEQHSWKARAATGVGQSAELLAYYAGLMEPVQPMKLTFQLLLLDGAPIAGLICGSFGDGLHALRIAYDERLARLAPGSAMLLMGVRQAIEGGYRFFNLSRGSGYYKARWLAEMRETRIVQVYRVGTPYYVRRALGDLWRRVAGRGGPPPAFNPARREVEAARPGPSAPSWSPGEVPERLRHAALVSQVLRSPAEFLSTAELAAILPFAARRIADAKNPHGPFSPRGSLNQGYAGAIGVATVRS
ncbi:MAG TPA: GNAT family N-acetyltransferase [Verrucomicrobiae bacterium]|nr:GNAT family N-acetyltransferase [Verrucomicrobiae bacterium]